MEIKMKNRFIKILPLLLALSVLIGMVSCLASCSFSEFVTDTVDGLLGKDDGNDNEAPDNGSASDDGSSKDDETADNQQKPDDSKDSETNTDNVPNDGATTPDSGTEEDETEEEVEFYPGQGSVPADKIDPKNRTLLSTVDIVANFGYTPSAGSGVIYKLDKEKGDAYIITNYHVVFSGTYGMALEAKLYLYGMRYEQYAITATVVGGSVNYDIAVLKVTGSEVLKNSYAMAADLGNSEDVRVFDDIFVVGNAEGYGMSVTEGIISVDSESLDMQGADGTSIELRVMRVSAAINRGNSGGAVYDESGKLIGIVVAKRTGSDVDNMGYAIPINLAKNLAENIVHFCSDGTKTGVQRPLIGITIQASVIGVVIDEATGEVIKSEIIEITELTETCIAKDLVKVGDIVNSITVDGVTVEVTRLHHVIDHMLNARVGSTVTMNVTRDGESVEATFTVPESAFTTMN